jgi:hypothetical protein
MEAALVEYCGGALWKNVSKCHMYIFNISSTEPKPTVTSITFGGTFYATIEELIAHINRELDKVRANFALSYDKMEKRVKINADDSSKALYIPTDIANILGFPNACLCARYTLAYHRAEDKTKEDNLGTLLARFVTIYDDLYEIIGKELAIFPVGDEANMLFKLCHATVKTNKPDGKPQEQTRKEEPETEKLLLMFQLVLTETSAPCSHQLDGGLPFIFVYVDCIDDVLIGSQKAPLMRILPVENHERNQFMNVRFDRPIYIPINQRILETVEVKLTKDTGEQIVFENTGRPCFVK